ncbi:unnamed protein product [Vicia faba]|uniref:Uncharacterized protein n=1 Tax=Vicia faba TaxID=3906 RepID=A0AAV0ZRY4_VICFA|nr:unnamed protein product [Vicia faba]
MAMWVEVEQLKGKEVIEKQMEGMHHVKEAKEYISVALCVVVQVVLKKVVSVGCLFNNGGNIIMLVLEESEEVVLLAATLRDKINPQAADATLLLAMDNTLCVFL